MDFRQAKRQLEALRKAKRIRYRESRRERREEHRLAQLPEDMKCPKCGKVKLKSHSWVLPEKICRSCFMKSKLVDKRFELRGTELANARKRAGITQARFAKECGWSAPYQCKLEGQGCTTISEASATIISEVLAEYGVEFVLT
jgi:ribosomal protein L32